MTTLAIADHSLRALTLNLFSLLFIEESYFGLDTAIYRLTSVNTRYSDKQFSASLFLPGQGSLYAIDNSTGYIRLTTLSLTLRKFFLSLFAAAIIDLFGRGQI